MKEPKTVEACNACGRDYPIANGQSAPEHGWYLPYTRFGYYNGFDDSFESAKWFLCHDCVVKFLDTFPLLAKDLQGCHPCNSETPCCQYAWKWDSDMKVLVGNSDGTWRAR